MLTVPTINIGALSAWYQLTHREDYKRIVPATYKILNHMRENMAAMIAAREMHEYFIKDKELTLKTVLHGINPETAEKLYSDPLYGMGSNVTLKEWVKPAMEKKPRDHPKYAEIQQHFGLSGTEMAIIFESNSMLVKLTALMQHLMKQKYNCRSRDCTDDELAYFQLYNQIVTRNTLVEFSSLSPIESYKDLNPDLILPPEMPYFKEHYNLTEEEKAVEIPNRILKQIFDLSSFSAKRSIFNPVNGEKFLQQMEAGVPLQDLHYAYVIGIKEMSFYTFLYKYLRFLISTFADFAPLGGNPKDNAFAELALLATRKAIKHISDNIQPALYARLLSAKFSHEKVRCPDPFTASRLDQKKITKICADIGFNFTLLSSFETWVTAALYGRDAKEFSTLKGRFDLTDVDMLAIFDMNRPGSIATHLSEVKQRAAGHYKCSNNKECDLNELVALQWGSSGVTGNVSGIYTNQPVLTDATSLQEWLPISDLQPQEYYAFGLKHYLNETMEHIKIDRTVAGWLASEMLPDQFELTMFAIYARRGNYQKIIEEYGVQRGYILHNYLRWLVEANVFGSPYKNRTARELAWGFYDRLMTQLRDIKYEDNGDPAFKNYINIAPLNVTLDYSSDRPLSELYTGQSSTDKTRTYARYEENANIMVWEEFYDGDDVVHHFRNPYPKAVPVDGTDGFQFSPKLTTEDSIKFFDTFALRPIKFNYDSKVMHGDIETYKFKLDRGSYSSSTLFSDNFKCPMLNVSSVYETPLFVALPYYSGCQNIPQLQNVFIDGKPVGESQGMDVEFHVEPFTGMTTYLSYSYEIGVHVDDNVAFPSLSQKVIPIMRIELLGYYPDDQVNSRFGDLNDRLNTIINLRAACIVVGSFFAILGLAAASMYFLQRRRKGDTDSLVEKSEEEKDNSEDNINK